mmetsp:Transcript_103045/g.287522  ORF Transcript_103045/g.287522 Transcript_103045/m.287522 type:complete len:268 (+) Transcript_103045:385-1188(+)
MLVKDALVWETTALGKPIRGGSGRNRHGHHESWPRDGGSRGKGRSERRTTNQKTDHKTDAHGCRLEYGKSASVNCSERRGIEATLTLWARALGAEVARDFGARAMLLGHWAVYFAGDAGHDRGTVAKAVTRDFLFAATRRVVERESKRLDHMPSLFVLFGNGGLQHTAVVPAQVSRPSLAQDAQPLLQRPPRFNKLAQLDLLFKGKIKRQRREIDNAAPLHGRGILDVTKHTIPDRIFPGLLQIFPAHVADVSHGKQPVLNHCLCDT